MARVTAGVRVNAGARVAVPTTKPIPFGLVDRNEQPDGDYGNLSAVRGWLCNASWDQLQPDFQGQALQGSKTLIGTLSTGLTLNKFNPALRLLQLAGGISTANVPANMLAGTLQGVAAGTILSNGYNVIQLDDGAGHTQVLVLASNVLNAGTTIKVSDCLPNFSYPIGTSVYYLTGTVWIDAAITWAQADPIKRWASLICFTGNLAPQWAKQLQTSTPSFLTDGVTNAMPRYELDSATAGTAGTTGPMWDANYQTAVQDLFTKLGAKYDTQFGLRAVRISQGGTIFMEPCLRHIAKSGAAGSQNAEVVSHMQVAGYTQAADVAMLGNYMDNSKAAFPSTASAMAFNAFNTVTRSFGPFPVTSYTGSTPVTAINLTAAGLPTTGWLTSNSCVLIYYYHGRISWTANNPNGASSFTVDAAGINSVALQNAAALSGTLFVRVAGVNYQVSSIVAATGVINLTTPLADSATVNGDLRGMPFWITDRTGLQSYAVSACTANSITISAGPNPAPQAGAFVTLHQCSNADETTTATLMTTGRSKLGSRLVIMNNSVAADNSYPNWGGANPYADIVARGAPIGIQTQADGSINGTLVGLARPSKLAIGNAWAMNSRWVELAKSYLATDAFTISASTRNVLTISSTPTNWGSSNRWSSGPGSYGIVVMQSGNLYFVAASNTTTLSVFAQTVADATKQASVALGTQIASGTTVATAGITLGVALGIAVSSGDLILLLDSATGNSQVFTCGAAIASATNIPVTGQPQGSGSAANATYPTATTKVIYAPLATGDNANGQTGTVYHWNYISIGDAKLLADTLSTCSPGAATMGRVQAATRLSS